MGDGSRVPMQRFLQAGRAAQITRRSRVLGLCEPLHLGVVDAAVVAVAEHHPGINHRRELREHRAPAVALYVDEAQQLRVLQPGAMNCRIEVGLQVRMRIV